MHDSFHPVLESAYEVPKEEDRRRKQNHEDGAQDFADVTVFPGNKKEPNDEPSYVKS